MVTLSILVSLASAVGAVAGVVGAVIACFRSPRPTQEELERWEQRSLSWPSDGRQFREASKGHGSWLRFRGQ
jgi:hypothetical protein